MSTTKSPDRPGQRQPSSSVDSSDYMEPDPRNPEPLFLGTRPSLLARSLRRLRVYGSQGSLTRRKREMTPIDKKDSTYWDKRLKNNDAARRSREKRRQNELMREGQLLALCDENAKLRAQVRSLKYHSSLSAERANAAEVSTAPLSARQARTHVLFRAGLGGDTPASFLGATQQSRAINPFDANISCFGRFDLQSSSSCGTQHGPFALSRSQAVLEGVRPVEDAQGPVSSSKDIPNSTIPAFLPSPDALRRASTLSYPSPNWLVPHENFLLPWRSSYRLPPAVYPPQLLHLQGQGLGAGADIQSGFRSWCSSAPAPDGH